MVKSSTVFMSASAIVATLALVGWIRKTPPSVPLPPPAPRPAPVLPTPAILPTLEQRVAEYLSMHEGGIRYWVYKDSRRIPTIGVGFSLRRPDARAKLAALGVDYDKVLAKRQPITKDQALLLMQDDVLGAIAAARRVINGYDTYPWQVQVVLADMAYNLGPTGLAGLRTFRDALTKGDYQAASRSLRKSLWFRQVGWRAEMAALILAGKYQLT